MLYVVCGTVCVLRGILWVVCVVMCVVWYVCCVSRDSLPSTLHRTHKAAAVTADTGGTPDFYASWHMSPGPSPPSHRTTLLPRAKAKQDLEGTSCQFTNSIDKFNGKAEAAGSLSNKLFFLGT